MPISASWTDPSSGGLLDLSNGTLVTQTHWDYIASDLLYLGGSGGAVTQFLYSSGAIAQSTTSGTPTLMSSPSVSMTTTGGAVLVMAGVTIYNSSVGSNNNIYLAQDSSIIGPHAIWINSTAGYFQPVVVVNRWAPTAGSHTYQLAWATSAGTLSATSSALTWITVVEFKR